jgi:hypothetical protein
VVKQLEAEAASARLDATLAEVAGAARQEAVWSLSAQVKQLQDQLEDTYWEQEEVSTRTCLALLSSLARAGIHWESDGVDMMGQAAVEMEKAVAAKTQEVKEMTSEISALEVESTSYKFIALALTIAAGGASLVYYQVGFPLCHAASTTLLRGGDTTLGDQQAHRIQLHPAEERASARSRLRPVSLVT